MENKVVLFPKAKSDLENIFKYIASNLVNTEAALKLISEFEIKFDELVLFPKAYPLIDNPKLEDKNLRKCLVENFLIVYRYIERSTTIEIVRVIHIKEDVLKVL